MGCCLSSSSHLKRKPKCPPETLIISYPSPPSPLKHPLKPEPKCPPQHHLPDIQSHLSKPDVDVVVVVNTEKQLELELELKEEEKGEKSDSKGALSSSSSSATKSKEEVDAILIQCGRLSRNPDSAGKRYSGSKRSHDFDQETLSQLNLGGGTREKDPLKQQSPAAARRASMSPGRRRIRRSNSPITRTTTGTGIGIGGKTVKKAAATPVLTPIDVNSLPFHPKSTNIDDHSPISLVSQLGGDKDQFHTHPLIASGPSDVLEPASTLPGIGSSTRPVDEALLSPNPAPCEDIRNFHEEAGSNKKPPPPLKLLASEVSDLSSCCSGSNLPIISATKYVTVRKRSYDVDEFDEELESSGSNSFAAGSQNRWLSSSSWEPNSADSSDCWTSSRSREDGVLPVSFPRLAEAEEGACGAAHEDSRKNVSSSHVGENVL